MSDKPVTFFISDTHFGHKAVIDYCRRPFRTLDGQLDVEAMDREMIRRWNARVQAEDTVYHLGDFALGPKEHATHILKQLRGQIVLIRGNHDRTFNQLRLQGFPEVHKELFLEVEGKRLYLHHQPMPEPYWQSKAEIHLCGHVHERFKRKGSIINVGVDQWGFTPITLAEALTAPESLGQFDIFSE